MSYPNPPGPPSAYPPPPSGGLSAQPGGPLRGRIPRRLGWIFLVVAVGLFVGGGIVLATKSVGAANKFQRVDVPTTTGSVTFKNTGKFVAYYEAKGVDSGIKQVPAVGVALQSPTGKIQTLTTPYGGRSDNKIKILTYDAGSHHGVALYQFTITESGTYRVATQPTSDTATDAKIAFGKSIATGTVTGALLIVGGVLFLIAAVVLLIVGYVKRARHKNELQSGQFYGGPPPGYPGQQPPFGGPPPPGYGTPPGYGEQPGYGSQAPGQPGLGTPPQSYGEQPGFGEPPR
jgi:hypothetical protein